MKPTKQTAALALGLLLLAQPGAQRARAWDYEGHRVVNQLALASLPTNFPSFVRATDAAERIAFLSGEPDRWRNVPDLALRHSNGPDHYFDIEQLADYGLKPEALPVFRYSFVATLALARQAHPERFPEINPARNEDHTRELVGFLPWAITEHYAKLKACFSYLKAYEEAGGTPDEISNAQADVIYVMGVMGHYIGDAGQPLHTTIHHHGWVGPNPRHYTTDRGFHSWIDGGFFHKVGGLRLADLEKGLRPAHPVSIEGRASKPEEMFRAAMGFVLDQGRMVEPVYELEKEGKLSGEGDTGTLGRAFLEGQLVKSAQFLGDVWLSAWQQAPPDTFLTRQLAGRQNHAR